MNNARRCNLCKEDNSELVSVVQERPSAETDFLPTGTAYYREIRKCNMCGAYFNFHEIDLFDKSFYEGNYNSSIGSGVLEERFKKIISLPQSNSDNKLRVQRIIQFLEEYSNDSVDELRVLDVGSGTGVFPYEMAKYFQSVSAVDPDKQSVSLMKKLANVENVWQGSISDVPESFRFDFISFNKVLEHLLDPFYLLNQAKKRLSKNGIVYIELPYAENIIEQGLQNQRAEFFIEHFTIYTYSSIRYLLNETGMEEINIKDLVDPSGKQTIYAFCKLSA